MKEIWVPIKGFEKLYEVSNLGNVRSVDRVIVSSSGLKRRCKGVILKQSVNKDGYNIVGLSNSGSGITIQTHLLVARHFIPNPNNLPEVNHKDENKTNNRVDNLEWCTHLYNSNYGCRNYLISVANKGKPKGPMSDTTKQKLSEAHKGKVVTKETREKLSKALSGENCYWYGKHLSTEHKKKISATRKRLYGKKPFDI